MELKWTQECFSTPAPSYPGPTSTTVWGLFTPSWCPLRRRRGGDQYYYICHEDVDIITSKYFQSCVRRGFTNSSYGNDVRSEYHLRKYKRNDKPRIFESKHVRDKGKSKSRLWINFSVILNFISIANLHKSQNICKCLYESFIPDLSIILSNQKG